ncbi:hypothetical protein N7455_003910 [Penicillium solitum]|uniref:Uncharacterized protein n=1 Tax=Penicillium solitum TaxID=60172 RepID=A0A1V6QUL4_9EURO|nr:uncharacterized protein PENSOL_c039G08706 [Penicillium solitum]KAF4764536.1 hypothetical protein HAV15_000668 [Penicillium sp. str. \
MAKKNKSQKAKSDEKPSKGPQSSHNITPNSSSETDFPPLPNSPTTESVPALGGRKGSNLADDPVGAVGETAQGALPSTSGLTVPGVTDTGKKDGEDDKGSLQIKIHLNLHAKIKLELDAQIYGDIVIGLL